MSEYRDVDRERETIQTGRAGPSPALVAFIVVGVLTVIFVLINRDDVTISLFGADVETKEWILVAVALVVGALLDRLVTYWWRRKRT